VAGSGTLTLSRNSDSERHRQQLAVNECPSEAFFALQDESNEVKWSEGQGSFETRITAAIMSLPPIKSSTTLPHIKGSSGSGSRNSNTNSHSNSNSNSYNMFNQRSSSNGSGSGTGTSNSNPLSRSQEKTHDSDGVSGGGSLVSESKSTVQ
jgi:hypothetical protein